MLEGLHPNRPTRVLRLEADAGAARSLTELLGEVFDPAETAVSAFESEAGAWLVEAYFATPPDEAALRALMRPILGEAADQASFTSIAPRDWVAASLEGLRPVRAGRFLVHGAHDRASVRTHDIALEIEAALAFGTGHHGTTRGCLLALASELKRRPVRRILDIGTGTGVLAMAAAKAVPAAVVASDIDPEAVRVARANARSNGVAGRISFHLGAGVPAAVRRGPRFDLVLANILARPLRGLAPALVRSLAPNGTLILSGLIPADVAGVLSAYAAQGLRLDEQRLLDGWATLTLRRGGAAPRPRKGPL